MRWQSVTPGRRTSPRGVRRSALPSPEVDSAPEEQDPGDPPAGIVFSDNWTGRNGSTEALLVGDVWDTAGSSGVLSVIDSTGLDFPSAQCVRVITLFRGDGGSTAQNIRIGEGLASSPLPALASNGDEIAFRWLMRCTSQEPWPSADRINHNIENGNGNQNWLHRTHVADDGSWTFDFSFPGTANPSNLFGLATTSLNSDRIYFAKDKTVQVELRIVRLDATTFNAFARVYEAPQGGWQEGSPGTLLYDESDFKNVNGSTNLGAGTPPVLTFVNLDQMRALQMGTNGTSPGTFDASNDEQPYIYFGCVAVAFNGGGYIGHYAGGV
jgi:hypothetical protein